MDFVDRSGELQPHLEADEKLLWCGDPDPPAGSRIVAKYRLFRGLHFMLPLYLFSFSIMGAGKVELGLYLTAFFTVWGYGFCIRPVLTPWREKKYLIYAPWYAKKPAVYGVTNRRALAKRYNTLSATPLLFEQITISQPRDPGHMNVSIGKSGFRFADVADGDAMLAALHEAGALSTSAPYRITGRPVP
jgi:hypothetical protein